MDSINQTQFKSWLTERLAELEPIIRQPATAEHSQLVAEAKAYCYALGWHDFALSLPDNEPMKTPLTAANQLRRCLAQGEKLTAPAPAAANGEGLFSVADAAKWAGVSPETVMDWINKKQLRASNVGKGKKRGRYRIQETDLQAFLKFRSTKA